MRLLNGYSRRRPTTPETAQTCLGDAIGDIEYGRYGRALGRFAGISQLGRTPFASKVIAFLCPERAGVYDNEIARGLARHPLLSQFTARNRIFHGCTDGIGQVHNSRIQHRYQAWCKRLTDIAAYIGKRGRGPILRALDVERRIFATITHDL